jgi:hypothetical protein
MKIKFADWGICSRSPARIISRFAGSTPTSTYRLAVLAPRAAAQAFCATEGRAGKSVTRAGLSSPADPVTSGADGRQLLPCRSGTAASDEFADALVRRSVAGRWVLLGSRVGPRWWDGGSASSAWGRRCHVRSEGLVF